MARPDMKKDLGMFFSVSAEIPNKITVRQI
jgi:hypothetical protein